jgi:hypothetical protein
MQWLKTETAPFERDLEVAVVDFDGPHRLSFPVAASLADG